MLEATWDDDTVHVLESPFNRKGDWIMPQRPERKRGAQPGNCNAVRSSARLLWKRNFIRVRDSWVGRPIQETVAGLFSDLAEPTQREKEIVETIARAKGCMLLVEREAKKHGLINEVDGRLIIDPVGAELRQWMKLELDGLRLLPLERRARTLDLAQEIAHAQRRDDADAPEQESVA
jgi:hypothetical protein